MPLILFPLIIVSIISCLSGNGESSATSDKEKSKVEVRKKDPKKFALGMAVFAQFCTSCHSKPQEKMCNDFMVSHIENYPGDSKYFFEQWVMGSQQFIVSGDEYAIAISSFRADDHNHSYKDSLSINEMEALYFYITECHDFDTHP